MISGMQETCKLWPVLEAIDLDLAIIHWLDFMHDNDDPTSLAPTMRWGGDDSKMLEINSINSEHGATDRANEGGGSCNVPWLLIVFRHLPVDASIT